MKKVIICAGIVLALLLAGLVSIRQIQSNTLSNVGAATTSPVPATGLNEGNHMSADVSNLPDIEYVPIYPGAAFLRVEDDDIALHLIGYEVDDSIEEVAKFYDEMLHKKGWVVRSLRRSTFLFTWTDPTGKAPWHLWLKLTIGPTQDQTGADKTLVSANYGRYPDTDEGLPVHGDARQVEVTHAVGQIQLTNQTIPSVITDVTYLTDAAPDTIADFYNTSMLRYGWFFYDPSNPGPQTSQSGSISSERGLTFLSSRDSWSQETVITDYLTITSTKQDDGQLLVRLHIEEIEAKTSNY